MNARVWRMLLMLGAAGRAAAEAASGEVSTTDKGLTMIALPSPVAEHHCELNHALQFRRSFRDFKAGSITLAQAGRLLWAAQGVTGLGGFRTAPSAGALYPLEVYLVVGDVDTLTPGVYKYQPEKHALVKTADGDRRAGLAAAALGQHWLQQASGIIAVSAVYARTTRRYGDRGVRYVHMEAGHVGQNVSLEAVALGMGATMVAAFDDAEVKRVLELPKDEEPLYLIPVGCK